MNKQEFIPVGYVPPAAVDVRRGGVPVLAGLFPGGGLCSGGGRCSVPGGLCPEHVKTLSKFMFVNINRYSVTQIKCFYASLIKLLISLNKNASKIKGPCPVQSTTNSPTIL